MVSAMGRIGLAVGLLGLTWGVLAQTPDVAENGILNAASYDRGAGVAPGSLAAIFGTNLAAGTAAFDSVPISTARGDVRSVTFNGVAAPIQFVSGGQINVQVPWNVPPGTANVVVNRGSNASTARAVQILAGAPGVFTLTGNGQGQAIAIIYPDGSLAAPDGSVPGFAAHPAKAGDTIILYATGLGAVTPPAAPGADSKDQLRTAVNPPTVLIGGATATVAFAGLAPEFPGVNQLNVTIPSGVTGSALPLQLRMGNLTSTDKATIAVQ